MKHILSGGLHVKSIQRIRFALIVALLWASQLLEINGSSQPSPASCLRSAAKLQGVDRGASCAFLGIPYAASTADSNRWKPPPA